MYAGVAIIVLALGIGASTAVFSVVDTVVLRALPFDEHHRLVAVGERRLTRASARLFSVAPQNFMDWRERQRAFDGLAAIASASFTLQEPGAAPEELLAQRVSSDFFDVLHVAPLMGRAFSVDEEIDGRHRVAIISHGLWQRRFGGVPDIVGTAMPLEGSRYEVVGVMPPRFSYPVASDSPTDVWVPLVFPEDERIRNPRRSSSYLQTIGRLREGTSLEQASTQMDQIALALEQEHPAWNKDRRVGVLPLHDHLIGDRTRSWMLLLLGAVAFVLLIACANVANLMLVRATVREREMAIRASLGATRVRLVRQLLVESLLLAAAGAALGLVLAWWGVQVLRGSMPENIPRVASIALDLRVLGVAVAMAVVTGLAFGLVPALQSSRPDLTTGLKAGTRGATAGAARQRLRSGLVIAEIALAVVLLHGAGLFIVSFMKLMRVDPGFDPDGVLTASVFLRAAPSALDRGGQALVDIVSRVRAIPDVRYASAISGTMPLSRAVMTTRIAIPGRTVDDNRLIFSRVTADYHRAMRIPLRRGRYIDDSDRDGTTPVVLINEVASQQYFPKEDPIGKTVDLSGTRRIIGVVGNVRLTLDGDVAAEAYVPLAQSRTLGGQLVIRTAGAPLRILPAVRAAVYSVLPDVPVHAAQTMEELMGRRVAQRRLSMLLLTLFGFLGLVIAAVGIYGLMAYVVAQRTHEIGVRMALGATWVSIITMVVGKAAWLAAVGLTVGGVGAWFASSTAEAFLFQLEPTDGRVFAGALVVLTACVLAASALPARRATKIDPMVALRAE